MVAREQLINKFDELEESNLWWTLFQDVDEISYKQEKKLNLTTAVAHSWQNIDKNRYRNVSAYDTSRVVLKKTSRNHSDYINASPLAMEAAERNYILTQGPLQSTCNDFWQMVWEQKCQLIIMLNKLVEKGSVNEENCDHYVVREFELTCKMDEEEASSNGDYVDQPPRFVKHFQFISWPDFGVPHNTLVFIEFLNHVQETGLLCETTPAVVHCSAGIGRSGTFVVADSVLSMVEKNVSEIDLIGIIVKMRGVRMGLIQTPQQLQFCWKTIADALRLEKQVDKQKSSVSNDDTASALNNADEIPGGHTHKSARSITNMASNVPQIASSTVRKRVSTDAVSAEKDAKLTKRKQRIEEMRARLRESENARNKKYYSTFGRSGIGYTCAAAALAVAVYLVYRMSSA